jgi:molybdopterin-guanine dinucleotide biosynthesis protein B
MRVFAVSGYSGTGKTTLIEKIIRSLVRSGHTVASIKSSIHMAGPDQGKDTLRHQQAGASMTIFLDPSSASTSIRERIEPEEWVELNNYDFLIVEGMKSADIPKFWCVGETTIEPNDVPVNTQAIVSWFDKEVDWQENIPIIGSDEIERLVEIIKLRSVDSSIIE